MSIVKDVFFGGAEKDAGEAGARATERGIAEQRRQFNQTRSDLLPFIQAGQEGLDPLLSLIGVRGPEAEKQALGDFIESPGQAFLRKRGERTLLRNASATGGLDGGNILKALSEFGIGTAAQQLGERKDRLSALTGVGSTVGTNLGGIGSASAANIGNLSTIGGQLQGQGITGRASGIKRGLGAVGKLLGGLF